jgi:hypothetical protein
MPVEEASVYLDRSASGREHHVGPGGSNALVQPEA